MLYPISVFVTVNAVTAILSRNNYDSRQDPSLPGVLVQGAQTLRWFLPGNDRNIGFTPLFRSANNIPPLVLSAALSCSAKYSEYCLPYCTASIMPSAGDGGDGGNSPTWPKCQRVFKTFQGGSFNVKLIRIFNSFGLQIP